MTDPSEIVTQEPAVVTVFEHHDAEGATVDVAVMGPERWQFMTAEQARDLAERLLDASDLAEECLEELGLPLR